MESAALDIGGETIITSFLYIEEKLLMVFAVLNAVSDISINDIHLCVEGSKQINLIFFFIMNAIKHQEFG